jgi:hypothetical protein
MYDDIMQRNVTKFGFDQDTINECKYLRFQITLFHCLMVLVTFPNTDMS